MSTKKKHAERKDTVSFDPADKLLGGLSVATIGIHHSLIPSSSELSVYGTA